jgi:hypothetical protein
LENGVKATIDLVNIKDDKVLVKVLAPTFSSSEVTYQIPKTQELILLTIMGNI